MFGKEIGGAEALQMVTDRAEVAKARATFKKKQKELLDDGNGAEFRGPDDTRVIFRNGRGRLPHITYAPLRPVIHEPTGNVAYPAIDVNFESKNAVRVHNIGVLVEDTGLTSMWPDAPLPDQPELDEEESRRFEAIQQQIAQKDLETVTKVVI